MSPSHTKAHTDQKLSVNCSKGIRAPVGVTVAPEAACSFRILLSTSQHKVQVQSRGLTGNEVDSLIPVFLLTLLITAFQGPTPPPYAFV